MAYSLPMATDSAVARGAQLHALAFDAFGVPVTVEVSHPALIPRIEAMMPPGARVRDPEPDDHHFRILSRDGITYRVDVDGRPLPGLPDVEVVLAMLERQLRQGVAELAPEHVFVHAGAAGYRGRAILIPGASFSGKTTLTHALIRAGASYYSDEYAVLDLQGRVHPYAKPLSIRGDERGWTQTNRSVEDLGGTAGTEPLPVGLVVVTRYRPEAVWSPQRLSGGDALLALLANTVPAQERPEQSMTTLRRALDGALAVEGERGDAADVARRLLELVGG